MGLGALDLNLLIALEALLEDRNVTHAGTRLCTSQSAMSGALARLRRHFDDDLLVRVGREYELTPLAERLLPAVRETLRMAERTLDLTRRFDPAASHQRFTIVMSDYAMTVVVPPLLALLAREAPGVRLDFHPLIPDQVETEEHLRRHDMMIMPLGYGLPGESEAVMHDRFVCILGRDNPAAADGRLDLGTLASLPHAAAGFGKSRTPADRHLETLCIRPRVQARAPGYGILPFLVAGTEMVALVPERLAVRYAPIAGCAIMPTPFDPVALIEGMHWHGSHVADPAHEWLRDAVRRVGRELDDGRPATGPDDGSDTACAFPPRPAPA